MLATNSTQAAAASAAAPVTPTAPLGRSKLEACFAAMLEAANVEAEVQDKFGTMALTKLALFTSRGKDCDRLRAFLAKPPLSLDEDKDVTAALSVAKLVSAWEAAKRTVHVENEVAAQRKS